MKTVLIVEDTEALAFLYEEVIEDLGYNVILAENGVEGFKKYNVNKPDAVITDSKMPIMAGQELVDIIREIDGKTPILFHSMDDLPTVYGIPNLYTAKKDPCQDYIVEFLERTIGKCDV